MTTFSPEHERLRRDLALMMADLGAAIEDATDRQTRSLTKAFIITNASMVLAVAVLAFGAARLA